jgi:hypothetical protein
MKAHMLPSGRVGPEIVIVAAPLLWTACRSEKIVAIGATTSANRWGDALLSVPETLTREPSRAGVSLAFVEKLTVRIGKL